MSFDATVRNNFEHSAEGHKRFEGVPREYETRTFEGPDGCSVSVVPERGGIVTSLRLKGGKEILHLDPDTLQDRDKNVRGGIPILFPFFGPVTEGIRKRFPGLDKQHGFARDSDAWSGQELPGGGFRETLTSDEGTKRVFPFGFVLSLEASFDEEGTVTITQSVTNTGNEDLPVSMGLHPYFAVPHDRRSELKFDFEGGDIIANNIEKWTNNGTTMIDNPGTFRMSVPGLGVLVMEISPEYSHILVWSSGPDAEYVCIEPVMRPVGGLVDDPALVGPGKTLTARITYRLKSEEGSDTSAVPAE
jgi:galactose mutarotase-like enzyme